MTAIQINFDTSNLSIADIANKLQIGYARAYKYIKSNGIPYKDGRTVARSKGISKKLTRQQENDICQQYKEGASITQVGLSFPQVNRITIFNVLKRNNIQTRLRSGNSEIKPPRLSKDELEYWYNVKEQSLWEIAERFGYPNGASVQRDCDIYGITRRNYSNAGKSKYKTNSTFRDRILQTMERNRRQWLTGKKTWIEQWCAEWLDEHSIAYVFQYKIPNSTLLHHFDFGLEDHKVLIEMDGHYWHKDRKQRDGFFDREAREAGYTVIRISDNDLKQRGKQVFDERLNNYVGQRVEGICQDSTAEAIGV